SRTALGNDQRGFLEAGRAFSMIDSPVKGLVPFPALRALTSRHASAPISGKRTRMPRAPAATAASKASLTAQLRSDFLTLWPFSVRFSCTRLTNVDAVHFCVFAIVSSVEYLSQHAALSSGPNGHGSKNVRISPESGPCRGEKGGLDQAAASRWR